MNPTTRQQFKDLLSENEYLERIAGGAYNQLLQLIKLSALEGKPLLTQIPPQIRLEELLAALEPVLNERLKLAMIND